MLMALLVAQSALAHYIKVDAPAVVLEHVRIIDGTGAAPREDATLTIVGGKIAREAPPNAQHIDLTGRTVFPGLVGMHDHLFYPMGGAIFGEMARSFPRLYLAAGVTTIRTTGALEPYTDIELKRSIDKGAEAGPKIFVTGPYLEGEGSFALQMHAIQNPDDARRTVEFWIGQGATSFKAYNFLTRAELKAAIDAAHKHGVKVTGHLCSIGFTEAAELGIDDLEHGILVDTEFFSGKQPDKCPGGPVALQELAKMQPSDPRLTRLIGELVKRHVALTSTLPVFDAFTAKGFERALSPRMLDTLAPDTHARLLKSAISPRMQDPAIAAALKLEMEFEHAFAAAGGLLLAGLDPTGNGAVVAGYGDQREVELLVDAGFTPLEALKIASLNGAIWLGVENRIGTLQDGKAADLVVVKGDPSKKINDIENVELVFKDGVGFDPAALTESVRGLVGVR